MTELTLEMLRTELLPIRAELAALREEAMFIRRSIVILQQDVRALRAAFNDFATVQPTSGEIEALHHDVNRVEAQNADLQLAIENLKRQLKELQGDRK